MFFVPTALLRSCGLRLTKSNRIMTVIPWLIRSDLVYSFMGASIVFDL